MDLISTAALLTAIDNRRSPQMALRDLLFPTAYQSDKEEIVLDEIDDDLEVAAYVSPDVATPESKLPLQKATGFKPGYIKRRHTVRPGHGLKRRPGEQINGTMSPGERLNAVIEDLLFRQDDQISRREEMMCAEVLRTGKVVISGDNIATYTADYARDASLTGVLGSGSRWGDNGVSITDFLEEKSEAIGDVSGANATDVILGSKALQALRSDDALRAILDNRRQADGSVQLGPVPAAAENRHLVYVGEIGDFRFWKYRQKFKINGTSVDVFPSIGCALVDPTVFNGYMCHGAILDRAAMLQSLPRFPKMFEEDDPAATFIMTQSAPLPVPGNVNASAYFAVVAA